MTNSSPVQALEVNGPDPNLVTGAAGSSFQVPTGALAAGPAGAAPAPAAARATATPTATVSNSRPVRVNGGDRFIVNAPLREPCSRIAPPHSRRTAADE